MTGISHKKTQMKMIQGTEARRVAFPKRWSGLFKKANELCNLCAVEMALVIFSSDGKAFSFGHPGVDTMVNKLGHPGKPDTSSTQLAQTEREATVEALNKEYFDLLQQLEAEEKRGEKLKQMRMDSQRECWMDKPIDELSLKELLTLKGLLEDVKVKLLKRMQELSVQSTPTTPLAANTGVAVDPSVVNPDGGCSLGLNSHGVDRN